MYSLQNYVFEELYLSVIQCTHVLKCQMAPTNMPNLMQQLKFLNVSQLFVMKQSPIN